MANIIVAGGSGAFGRAILDDLIGADHRVAVVDRADGASDDRLASMLSGVDLADETAVEQAYAAVARVLTPIHGLVNVAGGFVWDPVGSGSLENWDHMYRTNLRTAVVSCRAVLKHMAARGGAIVNVGAAGATNPGTGMGPYAAAKAGVWALTESLAHELKGRRIRVNAVLPTIIDTPANRGAMPDADFSEWVRSSDAAKVVSFLLSDAAGAVTGTGVKLSLGSGRASEPAPQ